MLAAMLCLRVDEVASGRNESVQELKGGLLVHGTQHALPGFAQAHGTELQRRDSDACCLGEDSVPAQRSGRLGCGLEERHDVVVWGGRIEVVGWFNRSIV